jgi:hypothetical protein
VKFRDSQLITGFFFQKFTLINVVVLTAHIVRESLALGFKNTLTCNTLRLLSCGKEFHHRSRGAIAEPR